MQECSITSRPVCEPTTRTVNRINILGSTSDIILHSFQVCRDVPTNREVCNDVPEERCDHQQTPVTRYEDDEDCQSTTVRKCLPATRQECHPVVEQAPRQTYETECTTEYVEECTSAYGH